LPAFKTWVSENRKDRPCIIIFIAGNRTGYSGSLLFLILTGILVYYAQHLYHRIKDIFYNRVAITAGVILTMTMLLNFLSDLIETDKIGSLFF
jgi:hypothetical protein